MLVVFNLDPPATTRTDICCKAPNDTSSGVLTLQSGAMANQSLVFDPVQFWSLALVPFKYSTSLSSTPITTLILSSDGQHLLISVTTAPYSTPQRRRRGSTLFAIFIRLSDSEGRHLLISVATAPYFLPQRRHRGFYRVVLNTV